MALLEFGISARRVLYGLCAFAMIMAGPVPCWPEDPGITPIMAWSPPPPGGKVGVIEGLDKDTLAALAESGVVQYFQPRKEKDRFDSVVGTMIYAPLEVVWKVAIDYEANCRLLPETYDQCETVSRQDNQARMHYKLHTSVLNFTFRLEITDQYKEDPPYSWHLDTVDGDLVGRELDLLLVPAGKDKTMAFIRYFGAMRSMNAIVRIAISFIPEFESPIYMPAATYHLRGLKNEAERLAGRKPSDSNGPLDYSRLDPKTLEQLSRWYGGLLRETHQGKVLNNMAFIAIDAPPEVVWETMTDFDSYNRIFPDTRTTVEKRDKNELVLMQEGAGKLDVYIFEISVDLHARYNLEPPDHMSYVAIDGLYKDSYGDIRLASFDNENRTFAFASQNVVLERDRSLTMRMVKSGAFPFESTVNMTFARDMLNQYKAEAEMRSR